MYTHSNRLNSLDLFVSVVFYLCSDNCTTGPREETGGCVFVS